MTSWQSHDRRDYWSPVWKLEGWGRRTERLWLRAEEKVGANKEPGVAGIMLLKQEPNERARTEGLRRKSLVNWGKGANSSKKIPRIANVIGILLCTPQSMWFISHCDFMKIDLATRLAACLPRNFRLYADWQLDKNDYASIQSLSQVWNLTLTLISVPQSVNRVVCLFQRDVCTVGQLYVALSRIKTLTHLTP